MSLEAFKTSDPGQEQIRFYMTGSNGNIVHAFTISNTGCGSKNYASSLGDLESLTYNGTEIIVSSSTAYSDYYYYLAIPKILTSNTSSLDTGVCTLVVFNPFAQEQDFFYNTYNATIGNAIDSRKSRLIYDVDRNTSQAIPANLQAILSGSATLAEVPDSNYSSKVFTKSRYTGTKTTKDDFGTLPAFGVTVFTGEIYELNTASGLICSKSYADRNIIDISFAPNIETLASQKDTYPKVRTTLTDVNKVIAPSSLGANDTTLNLYGYYLDEVEVGTILRVNTGALSNYELMKVESVTLQDFVVGFPGTDATSSFEVTRRYYSEYVDDQASGLNFTSGSSLITVSIVKGDEIFDASQDVAYRISNRKIWVEERDAAVVVDERGQVIGDASTC